MPRRSPAPFAPGFPNKGSPAPRGGVFREETVSHSRVAGEQDVGLADASKSRRKRRGMRPEEIQESTMVARAFPAGTGPGAPERRSRAGVVLAAGAAALAASALYNAYRA